MLMCDGGMTAFIYFVDVGNVVRVRPGRLGVHFGNHIYFFSKTQNLFQQVVISNDTKYLHKYILVLSPS